MEGEDAGLTVDEDDGDGAPVKISSGPIPRF
jgi:hypothetical protein